MAKYECAYKNCMKEVNTGFWGGRIWLSDRFKVAVCVECQQAYRNEDSKPLTEQSERHLIQKLELISYMKEEVKQRLVGDIYTPADRQCDLEDLIDEYRIIQSELQRRASETAKAKASMTTKVIIKEHVRLHCRYCGTLHEQTALKCPDCGAPTG